MARTQAADYEARRSSRRRPALYAWGSFLGASVAQLAHALGGSRGRFP